jgi:hypothetical protein
MHIFYHREWPTFTRATEAEGAKELETNFLSKATEADRQSDLFGGK